MGIFQCFGCASAPEAKYAVGAHAGLTHDAAPKEGLEAPVLNAASEAACVPLKATKEAAAALAKTDSAADAATALTKSDSARSSQAEAPHTPQVQGAQQEQPQQQQSPMTSANPSVTAPSHSAAFPTSTVAAVVRAKALPMVATPDGASIGAALCPMSPEDAVKAGLPYSVHALGPPPPPCEPERLKTMQALQCLDAPPDPELESILKLVASVFNAPATLVALFDDKRIFIRNATGAFSHGDFPWRYSFCAWTMASRNPQIMVIPDATKDSRFCENNFVQGAPGVRFYCGTPLMAGNGHRLGTLCFADFKPRKFDAGSCLILNNLAEMVVRHIEKDVALQVKQQDNVALQAAYGQLQRTMDSIESCVVMLDTQVSGWKIMYTNQAWTKMTGVSRDAVVGKALDDVISTSDGQPAISPNLLACTSVGRDYMLHKVFIHNATTSPGGAAKPFLLRFRPASQEALGVEGTSQVAVGVPSYIQPAAAGASVEDSPAQGQRYYFMTVESYGRNKAESSAALSSGAMMSEMSEEDAIEGLSMGHLLGKGGFGSVYYGTWFGTPVAVKVIEEDVKAIATPEGATSLEASLGQDLQHPNIVATLKYVVRKVTTHVAATATSGYSGGSGTPGGADVTGSSTDFSNDTAMAVSGPGSVTPWTATGASAAATLTTGGMVFTDAEDVAGAAEAAAADAARTPMAVAAAGPSGAWSQVDSRGSVGGAAGATPGSACAYRVADHFQTIMLLEYCDKGSLQDAVDRGWLRDVVSTLEGGINLTAVLVTAREVASALALLHSRDIIHGDMSAWNVMLSSGGTDAALGGRDFVAKVADFGLARTLITSKVTTRTYGTMTHMPPETLCDGIVSRATDVYSMGVLLWQMLTSSRPWAGMTHSQIVMEVGVNGGMLAFTPGTAPAAYERLALDCMRRVYKQRPTMDEVVAAIDAMQATLKETGAL